MRTVHDLVRVENVNPGPTTERIHAHGDEKNAIEGISMNFLQEFYAPFVDLGFRKQECGLWSRALMQDNLKMHDGKASNTVA